MLVVAPAMLQVEQRLTLSLLTSKIMYMSSGAQWALLVIAPVVLKIEQRLSLLTSKDDLACLVSDGGVHS